MAQEVLSFCLRLELDRRVEILEYDEELEENVAAEVGVTQLQFQQLLVCQELGKIVLLFLLLPSVFFRSVQLLTLDLHIIELKALESQQNI
jgi:hypothetical protein